MTMTNEAMTAVSSDAAGDDVAGERSSLLPPDYVPPRMALATVSGFGNSTVGELPNGTITAILCQTYGVFSFFCDLDPDPDDWQIMVQMMQACVGRDGKERNVTICEDGVDLFVCWIAPDSPWGLAARSMGIFA